MDLKISILRGYAWEDRILVGESLISKIYQVRKKDKKQCFLIKQYSNCRINKIFNCLQHQIALLKRVQHQNIAELLDYSIGDQSSYLIFPYFQYNLITLLHVNKGQLKQKQSIGIITQLINAITELNKYNFIHRDIRPENIFFKDKVLKLCDFGMSSKSTEKQSLISHFKSPFYVSPQIANNLPYSYKTDIWNIGIIFYQMLFGTTPWPSTTIEIYKKSLQQYPLRFPFDNPIGSIAKQFISKCLEIQEQKRLSLQQIMHHPLIKKGNAGIVSHIYKMDPQTLKIVKNLQQIYSNNKQIITKNFLEESYDQQINMFQFFKFIRKFFPEITFKQNRIIFEQADVNNNNKVDFNQLIRILEQYNFEGSQQLAIRVIIDLRKMIKLKDLKLKQLYYKVDSDKRGLDIKGLAKFIKLIAPDMLVYNLKEIFQKIDKNNDQKISIEEIHEMFFIDNNQKDNQNLNGNSTN